MDEGRDLVRRDSGRLGLLLGGIGRGPPPESKRQERDGCGSTRDSESVHGISFEGGAGGITGSVTIQDVPAPSTLSKRISPPNFLTMRRATVNPRPDPSPWPLVVKNGSKIFERCCFGMPGPESAMVVMTDSPATMVERRSVPLPFMAWTALIRRFVKACLS